MENQKVVVFGGGSGVGEATARLLVKRGAQVTITGRDEQKLGEAKQRIGLAVATACVDGSNRASVGHFFAQHGALDHVVLTLSGGKGAGLFRELDLADIESGMHAKLFAQLQVAQAALPVLRTSGSITFVSAISARTAMLGTSGLAAINGALEAMVPGLAKELAPIRVNAVSPGIIDTPWWNGMPPGVKDSFFQQAAAQLPVRRVGHPDDVAQAIVLLIENGFMTGTVLEVDGGAHIQ